MHKSLLRLCCFSLISDCSLQTARCTVRGSLNGVEFSISRTKTASRGSLIFVYDGEDLSTQSTKDTQALIDEKLGTNPQVLARTLFHGQHAMNELLEASDTRLKEELSLVTPLASWQAATLISRKQARLATQKVTELQGMITIRSEDHRESLKRLKLKREALSSAEAKFKELKTQYDDDLVGFSATAQNMSVLDENRDDLESLHENLASLATTLVNLELEHTSLDEQRCQELGAARTRLSGLETSLEKAMEAKLDLLGDYESWSQKLASAKKHTKSLESMWKVSLERGIPDNFSLPSTCPTCQQTLLEPGNGHAHKGLETAVLIEMEQAVRALQTTRGHLASAFVALKNAEDESVQLEKQLATEQKELDRITSFWDSHVGKIHEEVQTTRHVQEETSKRLADTAIRIQQSAKIQQLSATLEAEQQRVSLANAAVETARAETEKYEAALLGLSTERDMHSNSAAVLSSLSDAFGQRGIQTFVLKNAVGLLEAVSQAYLTHLSDGCLRLRLQLDSGDRISRRAFVCGRGGQFKERPLASLSGGQWRRCSLALSFGFAELVAQRGNFRSSICILDEPLTHLDQAGRADVGKVVRRMVRRTSESGLGSHGPLGLSYSTVLLILQDLAAEELEESFDRIDEVVMRGGSSSVLVDC